MYSTLFRKLDREALLREALNLSSEDAVSQYHLQSATYNVVRNSVVLGFSWEDEVSNPNHEALLIEMRPDFAQVKGVHQIAGLYHCNDMTYNPNTNKIYVALCDDNVPGIGVINASTMQKEGDNIRFSLGQYGGDYFAQITYDAASNQYYLGNSSALHIADGNFNIIKSIHTQNGSCSEPIGAPHNYGAVTYLQGSDMVDGEFARVWSISEGSPRNQCTITASRLEYYDFDTGAVTHFIDFPTRNRYHEAEAILFVGERYCLIGYDDTNIYVEEIKQGDYNFGASYLSADKEVDINSSNLVANKAIAERFYHKKTAATFWSLRYPYPPVSTPCKILVAQRRLDSNI